jgi:hypothetical protein
VTCWPVLSCFPEETPIQVAGPSLIEINEQVDSSTRFMFPLTTFIFFEMSQKSKGRDLIFWTLVPRQIVALWLELVQGNHPTVEEFGAAREQLYRKVEANRTDPFLLAALACADVALGRKEESIQEGRRAMEMRPISEDAVDGPIIAANVASVHAWANQSDFAFEQLNILIKLPDFVTYGDIKTNPSWDPLRKDPRFEKLLAELAPKD